MSLSKRDFLQVMASASAAGMALGRYAEADAATAEQGLYDVPPFGNVSLLHRADGHAQLLPSHFREPSVNLGGGAAAPAATPIWERVEAWWKLQPGRIAARQVGGCRPPHISVSAQILRAQAWA